MQEVRSAAAWRVRALPAEPHSALPENALALWREEKHDRSFAIRDHRENISLADRGAAAGAISDRLVDAGYSSRHEAGRRHDIPYFLRNRHLPAHRRQAGVAAYAPRGTGKFAAAMAATEFGSRALAAVCAG